MKTKLLHHKKIWLTSLLIVVSSYNFYAQNISVTGVWSGQTNDSLMVCFNHTRSEYKKIKVDENHRFSFTFKPEKLYNFIGVEKNEILLQPGDSVVLSLQNDSIVGITGGNSILNQSLICLQQSYSGLWENIEEVSFLDFQHKVSQWYNAKLLHINSCSYLNGNVDRDIANSFLNLKIAAVSNAFLVIKFKDTIQYALAINSPEFARLSELKDFKDTVMGPSLPYYLALEYYLRNQMNIAYDNHKSYLQNLWDKIIGMNLPKPNNDVAYCIMNYSFFNIGYSYYDHFFQDADTILNYFEMNAREKENAIYLKTEFESAYGYLRPGRQISDVELYDTIGNKLLLSGFKDKIIYVKLWAIGCKGCIQSIPEYNELLSNVKDTNVVFMSIAMNDIEYKDRWKAAIRKYDLKGLNFISEKGLDLGSCGLPTYYIIGRNNTIVNLDAPGPGYSGMKTMLEELIKE